LSEKRRKYTQQFKIDAVFLAQQEGMSIAQAARDLGIGEQMLGRWIKQYEQDGSQAFPGSGRLKPEDEQLRRLRRELDTVRQERDILKKAVVIFSREKK
jgi:transposase-like protein